MKTLWGTITDPTRQIVTLILILTASVMALRGMIDPKDFLSLVTLVALFWFKDRADDKAKAQTIEQLKTMAGK